jgi:hypothetical protein
VGKNRGWQTSTSRLYSNSSRKLSERLKETEKENAKKRFQERFTNFIQVL